MEIDEELLERYKGHPRVLEVRFLVFFEIFIKEYGYDKAMKIFKSFCSMFNCNMSFLQSIINRRFELKRNNRKKFIRWRQEVIFSSLCYGESLYKTAKDYLNVTPEALYMSPELYDPNKFVSDEWLRELDEEVSLCSQEGFRIEVSRFFEELETFISILGKWEGRD